ncbi:excinuclease ABC subunit UvrA [Chlorobium phaeobacteroides]|uniref:UvrABC system protein A n=1 Tax=Chlorobium phaeobacteroides (strain DSM 266 / SMG 266 / 2430) TaxID=290317 RepID=A1BHS8_CHLPD|nr:excinuclease ABC subunit UvrA [Chlorobium phaeobacteroides]ABL65955.1 Excinuclease ABC subunit A [Chlorobium phaeobacteroides DSM 266]
MTTQRLADTDFAESVLPDIVLKGVCTHNLKNITVHIPRNRFVVLTGVSGSGKSSLAFDTLYAEGHRRYVESLSAYVRQFLERMPKPPIEIVEGIAPAVAIEQKPIPKNPRSTVGSVSEIYDYLRLLYARVGKIYSRDTDELVLKHTPDDVSLQVRYFDEGAKFYAGFPFPCHTDEAHHDCSAKDEIENLLKKGFFRIIDGDTVLDLNDAAVCNRLKSMNHLELSSLLVLVDRFVTRHEDKLYHRVAQAAETGFMESGGYVVLRVVGGKTYRFSDKLELNGIEYLEPSPQLFAFNSPIGACKKCQGFGRIAGIDEDAVVPDKSLSLFEGAIVCWNSEKYRWNLKQLLAAAPEAGIPLDVPYEKLSAANKELIWKGIPGKRSEYKGIWAFFAEIEKDAGYKMHYRVFLSRYRGYATCPECEGSRLNLDARLVRVSGRNISEVTRMNIAEARNFFLNLDISPFDRKVAEAILEEIIKRLGYLLDVGLDYLTLDRLTHTLSGGEFQRINLSTSIGSPLVGAIYVLDEPSIGLHQSDSSKLIALLRKLRDLGNTVVVVEHDREIIEAADEVIDLGPKAGRLGGEVVFQGTISEMKASGNSLTAEYLNGEKEIAVPKDRRKADFSSCISIKGAMQNNLKNIDVRFPLGIMTCVTGVSGSGKSTLVNDILKNGLLKQKEGLKEKVGTHRSIGGVELIDRIEHVDQSPIGKSSRSNPVTYLKIFDDIRMLFAQTVEAKARGLHAGYFSFNIPGGRCEACAGEGVVRIEMQFLADIEAVCEECGGSRYKQETLEITFNGRSIMDVLDLTVSEAIEFFNGEKNVLRKLQVLEEVGLGYIRLGQSSSSLSGGEAQRLKLASFIAHADTRHTLFLFDEPTTGLHFEDISKLIRCFEKLLEQGNTLVIIEHNPDIIKQADWVIDLGPGAGDKGGSIMAEGTPEKIVECKESLTGLHLKPYLHS